MVGIIACEDGIDKSSQGGTHIEAGTCFHNSGKTLYRAA
jgi:hypothetical protein